MAQVIPRNAPNPAQTQGADQGTPPGAAQAGQPQVNPEGAIKMIQTGFMELGKMIQAAGNQLDPQDIKLFQGAVQSTDNFIQAITGPAEPPQQQRKAPSQPLPANASVGAQPSPNY